MKILFIHNRYRQAGGEDVAVSLESGLLVQMGHTVQTEIFQNQELGSGFAKLRAGINAIYNRSSYSAIRKQILDFKPDIIHIHNLFFTASPSVLFIAKKLGIPVVLTIHNYRLICSNALLLREGHICELCVHQSFPLHGIRFKCYRHSALESAMVTLVTGIHKKLQTWNSKVNKYIVLNEFAKSKIAHSGLNLNTNQLVVKANFVPDPGEGVWPRENFFLFVGRIAKEKGIATLLEAFAEKPGYNILLAGDGPEKSALEMQYGFYENIKFLGNLEKEKVQYYMKRTRALIFPSIWYEGLPYTIIEAFATATPVIASRLGAMQEMIEDGVNGYHFIVNDSADLCKKLDLLSGITERKLYLNARASYEQHYNPEVHYKSILEIYESVIGEAH